MPKYPKNFKDVEYYVPGRKRRVAGSTKATSDLLAMVHETYPTFTITQLREVMTDRSKCVFSRRRLKSSTRTSRRATETAFQIGGKVTMAIDYKEKIRKLLALAESPVEAEARAALLKARQLMAEHKLTERECREAEKQAVKDVLTDITCSKRREPWIIPLSATIGESYCCKGYRKRFYGQQTQHVGFIGLEDDVEICIAVFKYAVDCIRAGVKNIKREYAGYASYYSKFIKQECDSYGYGFVMGVGAAFEQQEKENREEWGLVLVMPKEVTEAAQRLGKEAFKSRAEESISAGAYYNGYSAGKEFNPARRLSEGAVL